MVVVVVFLNACVAKTLFKSLRGIEDKDDATDDDDDDEDGRALGVSTIGIVVIVVGVNNFGCATVSCRMITPLERVVEEGHSLSTSMMG